KAALLGYVANKVMDDSGSNPERNPGRLPCPEYSSCQSASGSCTPPPSVNDGVAAAACPPPAVGRLPWRTLGLDKLTDASGQPLWYVVSPGWALQSTGSTLQINFNTSGQLSVDNQSNAAVGLIVAPGPPIQMPASTTGNCPARTQSGAVSPPDYRDYLECPNAASPVGVDGFATTGVAGAFNDQVVQVTAADVMRVIEGPIAQRIQAQIVPAINNVYFTDTATGKYWGNARPLYPFAAPFNNPTPERDLLLPPPPNDGSIDNYEGVLPLAPDASSEVGWLTSGSFFPSCAIGGGANCGLSVMPSSTTISYSVVGVGSPPPTLTIWAYASAVGTGFRQPPGILANVSDPGYTSRSIENTLRPDGKAMVVYQGTPPLGNSTVTLTINAADDPITDWSNATTGWFIRNQWYKFTYYAVSGRYTPGGNQTCTGGPASRPCLTINVDGVPNNNIHALLVFAGRFLTGVNAPGRPSGQLASYFENANKTPPNNWVFETHSAVTSSFNDRAFAIAP
ncbi:MAG TPA: hypothetical protein VFG00_02245, partial [Acidothermaceae bacterium]|nr:hypothetical protein [Acidothermaceae bacterium]